MAAPKGNQFWAMRAKHGCDEIFESPEKLWEAACEYFEFQSGREWIQTDFKGKDAVKCEIPTSAPFTMKGLCLFLGVSERYFNHLEKMKAEKEDWLDVITRIKDIVFLQKFEGATVGAYNANIISRDLGLAEHKKVSGKLTLEDLICGVEEGEDEA